MSDTSDVVVGCHRSNAGALLWLADAQVDAVDDDLEESARFYEEDNGELHIRSDFLIDDDENPRAIRVAFILNEHNAELKSQGVLFSIHDEDGPVFRLLLAGCDAQRIEKLEEGVATEADVRAQFGEPAAVLAEADGSRTFEYPRQPEGWTNYRIQIGADGTMSSLRQLLNPDNFARVKPGLTREQVRELLGRPAKTWNFPTKPDETIWDWRTSASVDRPSSSLLMRSWSQPASRPATSCPLPAAPSPTATTCCRCTPCGAKWPMPGCRPPESSIRPSSARWPWPSPNRRGQRVR